MEMRTAWLGLGILGYAIRGIPFYGMGCSDTDDSGFLDGKAKRRILVKLSRNRKATTQRGRLVERSKHCY